MNSSEINRRAKKINKDDNVRQKAVRAHAALISYFDGNDLTGKIKGVNSDAYAACISVLTDSGVSGFSARRNKNPAQLRNKLSNEFKEAGFVGPDGDVSIPGRDDYSEIPSTSIGPLLPGLVAILEVEHGIDSIEAVRQYRPDSLEIVLPDEEDDLPSIAEDRSDQDWESEVQSATGFDPNAMAYVYVLTLERLSDSSRWYYVGKAEGGYQALLGRIRSHAREFSQSRVVLHDDQDILRGKYNASMEPPGRTHRVTGIDRIVPIQASELRSFDNSAAEACYISEIERRTAYEVAVEHETSNVLGGK